MSILLTKILWSRLKDRRTEAIGDNLYESPIVITDIISITGGKGMDIKNNVLSFTLKNDFQKNITYPDASTMKQTTYVNSSKELMFEEQDQIKVYAKYTDDGADFVSDAWSSSSTTAPSDDYLIGSFYIAEFNPQHVDKAAQINVKCVDKTYVLFNRILAKAFTATDGLTAPEMIQKVIRYSSQNPEGLFQGTAGDAGTRYDVDARLVSESGYITDTRRNTKEDGSANANTDFPEVELAKVWKPVYEWIKDLSQVEMTNSVTEQGDVLVYGRPFIFWVDESNAFHWVYPSDTPDSTIVVGTDEVRNANMSKSVFDVTNMIIYNVGDDMYGTGLYYYAVDLTSKVRTLKMRYVPMTDISKKWISADYATGTLAADRDGAPAGKPVPQFPTSYPLSACVFPPTENFANVASISDDGDYNDALRERCLAEGDKRAKALLSGLSNARWKGTVTMKGTIYAAGDLIKFTDDRIGLNEVLIRVMTVRHSFNKNGWQTTLELEQDTDVLVNTGV